MEMDLECGALNSENAAKNLAKVPLTSVLLLAYQSIGVVYGDLATSPLYVYSSSLSHKKTGFDLEEEEIIGVLSFLLWTFTLIPLVKYVFFVLNADDEGEGGAFALYSLLCKHANLSLLRGKPQVSGEKEGVKKFLEKHERARLVVLLIVMLATGMIIVDGVLTPAISVLSAVSGMRVKVNLHENFILAIACGVLIGLFALQHYGTHRVAFLFAPIVIVWLSIIGGIGLYNTLRWNRGVFRAFSPRYMYSYLRNTGREGLVSLAGVLLCITGAEAMFADLGHFSRLPIKMAFVVFVYPCLILSYIGEAAFLTKHQQAIHRSFYMSIPECVFWPAFIAATLASAVGSQAVISATFSVVHQCSALDCFPQVKVVHTSKRIYGQVYVPEVNWILMLLCLAVTLGFRDTVLIGHAYGISVITVMFITTCLMVMVIIVAWKKKVWMAASFFLVFGSVELLYLCASLIKVPQGGWFTLLLSTTFVIIMYVWHYGRSQKYEFDMQNKVPMDTLLGLGPSLGIVRVPGIGLIYTELPNAVPPIFGHFMTNLPAFHQVLVFVCVRSLQVPTVPTEERYLIGRIGTKEYRMFQCIVRYGYTDIRHEDHDFENQLVLNIAEFIRREDEKQIYDSGMTVLSASNNYDSIVRMVHDEQEEKHGSTRLGSKDEWDVVRKKKVRFVLPNSRELANPVIRKELSELIEAQEAGVVYILEHSYIQAKKSSFLLKKITIDVIYAFLRRNCRGPAFSINAPHISLIEAGMIYHV